MLIIHGLLDAIPVVLVSLISTGVVLSLWTDTGVHREKEMIREVERCIH